MPLIGRDVEINTLNQLVNSDKAEFVAVYGRRRIGKTFLIKTFFNENFTFYATGLANANTLQQLSSFCIFINQYFDTTYSTPKNWIEAFNLLVVELRKIKGQKIIFIDELPWLDTKKSDFITGLDFFWNSYASSQADLKMIVCGSAASWIINKLIKNKGGLHNRLTARIKLESFTLKETEQFFQSKDIRLDRYQILQLYMTMGGVPYYLEQVQKGLSAAQNIENICFENNGLLKTEFKYIFSSLFSNGEKHELILRTIYEQGGSATRENILRASAFSSGGDISTKLSELEESGFITSYIEFGLKAAKKIYCISDFYTLFYLKFIEHSGKYEQGDWVNRIDEPSVNTWAGVCFEQVCFLHTQQVKNALKIAGISSKSSTWRKNGTTKEKGTQIDLVIDRRDRIINLCEIKYSINPYTITKNYDQVLRNKLSVFKETTKTRKAVFMTMLTTYGLIANEYSRSIIQNEITMDDLFL